MQLYKGYVPTKDKKCLMPFKNATADELLSFEQVKNLPEYAGILSDETILDGNTQTTPKVEARTLSDQEKTIVESLFSDGTPVEDAMTQIMNSPELKTLVSLHPKYKALFN